MINNGIISFGDNNVNIINNKNIYNELKILLEHINRSDEDYTIIKEAIHTKEKNKILELLKKLSKKGYSPVQLIFQHPEKSVNPKWKMDKILKEAFEPSKELLDDMGIKKEWLNRWPSELSGGELQRFCVVRALSPETKFLIADEMTTMLDAITQAQIWNVVLEHVKKYNIGLIVISHEKALVNRICDRIVDLTEFKELSSNIE